MNSETLFLLLWLALRIESTGAQTPSSNCAKGYWATSYDYTQCQPCQAGKYAPTVAMTFCYTCVSGTYSFAGSSYCSTCPLDTVTAGAGQSVCTACAAGTHAFAGATTCTTCAAGSYYTYSTSIGGLPTCTTCAAMTFSRAGDLACSACASGAYSAAGTSFCTLCAVGKYLSGTSCQNCLVSTFSSTLGATTCQNCGIGRYAPSGSSFCEFCVAGTYADSESGICIQCNGGSYSSGIGATVCTLCAADTYTTMIGASACTACATNTYALKGAIECTPCNGWITCQDYTYMTKCKQCPNDYFYAYDPSVFCVNNNDRAQAFQYCQACLTTCDAGDYLNFVCDNSISTKTTKNTCQRCETGSCEDQTKYRTTCTTTQNSACVLSKTQCAVEYFLNGHTDYQDGECERCTTCPSTVLTECSNFQNRLCQNECKDASDGTAAIPCATHQACIFESPVNLCVLCPSGFMKEGEVCKQCPKGAVCNQYGEIQYWRTCAAGTKPQSTGCVTCSPSSYVIPKDAVATTAGVDQSCVPFFRCKTGYYRSYNHIVTEDDKCQLCSLPTSTTSGFTIVSLSHGLQDTDHDSCLYEEISTLTKGNAAGFYAQGASMLACPLDTTSLANYASAIQDCLACPTLPNNALVTITNNNLCSWQCKSGYTQYGITCRPLDDSYLCQNSPGYVLSTTQTCVFRPIPWQIQGHAYQSTLQYTVEDIVSSEINYKYHGLFYSANPLITTAKKVRYKSTQTNMFISTVSPGLVCSATSNGYYFFMAFCNTSMIMYLQQGKYYRLIGRNESGYAEGFRDTALFGDELYLYMSTDSNRLIVLDTYNNCFREVVVGPNGPGDFRTKSYRITTSSTTLYSPRFLFPLHGASSTVLGFMNNYNTICQFQSVLRIVACTSIVIAVADMPVISMSASDNNRSLNVYLTLEKRIYQNTGNSENYVCPDDTTSLPGGDCTVAAPFNGGVFDIGFYILDGVKTTCTAAVCPPGYYADLCTRHGPSTCKQCVLPENLNVTYYVAGSCDYHIMAPCPFNMYADANKVCIDCPHIMHTDKYGSVGLDSCLCEAPLIKSNSECVLPAGESLFPMFQAAQCPFTQYKTPNNMACVYCIDEPCILPNVGEYATACYGTLQQCTIPSNAYATTAGQINQPTSCQWTCNAGYQKNNNGDSCIVCTNKPGSNTDTYYYDGCSWEYYI